MDTAKVIKRIDNYNNVPGYTFLEIETEKNVILHVLTQRTVSVLLQAGAVVHGEIRETHGKDNINHVFIVNKNQPDELFFNSKFQREIDRNPRDWNND